MFRLAWALLLLFAATTPGQAPPPPSATTPQAPVAAPLEPTTTAALEQLAAQLAAVRAEQRLAADRGDATALATAQAKEQQLGWQFAGLAARFDVQGFEAPQPHDFDLQKELEQLVRPLLSTLKDATAGPRQVADLEARIEALQQRRVAAEKAMHAVERTRDALPDGSPARGEAQRELDGRWRKTIDGLRSETLLAQAQLQTIESSRLSLVDNLTRVVRDFVQSSGLSLLLAATVFVTLFFGLRALLSRTVRAQGRSPTFSLRLLDVVLHVLTFVVAVVGAMVVPYVRNDWLLLAVGIVFLLGAGWALVRTLPLVFEQVRLVLNVGGVREGERLVVDGLPWRVDALRFHTHLSNPELAGGRLRLPIKDMIGRRSRRGSPDEPWFPCRQGDVVALTDGVLGTVRLQTPEVVVVAERDDAPRSYPTAAFLQLRPRNLSQGFCLAQRFALDYRHQAEALTSVPGRLQEHVAAGLGAAVAPHELKHVRVEFAAASPSSLDFEVLAEFTGGPALRYRELERRLQALLVAACNAHGYHIPLPQLTVHRATP